MNEKEKELIAEARKAMKNAFTPFSSTKVGAAILTEKGKIFTGCNIVSSLYWLSLCAERVAIANAVSSGERKFKAIAIASNGNECITPCGGCRQALYEFSLLSGKPIKIISSNRNGKIKQFTLSELYPFPFTSKKLKGKIKKGKTK